NRIAVAGHNLLYGRIRRREAGTGAPVFGAFAAAVRRHAWAAALSALMFFGSALATFVAVQIEPALGYDLLADEFIDFDPATPENLHDIPSLARPVVSSMIISNDIHLGSVAGWMTLHGKERALWGWIMPHGATELLAICLAGAAGYLLASA